MGILDSADRVDVLANAAAAVDAETNPSDNSSVKKDNPYPNLTFAEPDTIVTMMNVLGIDPSNVDDATAAKMKKLYQMSKNQDLSLDAYLIENGRKVGGRGMPGFLDNLFVHASMENRERELKLQRKFKLK